jgi:hypothetical protein
MNEIYEQIRNQLINVDTEGLSNDSQAVYTNVIEEQKIYFWTRLYLTEENLSVEIGDDISIEYVVSGEKLKTKFICYDKKGVSNTQSDDVTSYETEDNKKILCLMVDSKMVNYSDEVPFIRTLFKTGYHYDYQLVKRSELLFIHEKTGISLEYFDVDF